MPPRPRPRPKARPATTSEPSASSSAAGALPTQDDEDKLFLRNRNLTTQSWKNLNNRSEVAMVIDTESNKDGSPRKTRKKQDSNNSMPSWTLPQARAGLNSVAVDEYDDLYTDDSDEDLGTSSQRVNRSPKKAKLRRSRSRSITPPPTLTFAQVQTAKNIVRNALGMGARRAPSPKASVAEEVDESTDTIILDPELASVARAAKSESYLRSRSTPIEDDAPTVSIKVRWKPHPLNKEGQSQVHGFIMKRTNTFRQVFDEIADSFHTLVDDLIVSYKGRRIYSSVSPSSMNIWMEAELDACGRQTFEYMRTNNIRFSAVERRSTSLTRDIADSENSDSDVDSDNMSQTPHGAPDTFKLTLRSDKTPKDIFLTVRPSTKCGAIVKGFLIKAGLEDKYLEADPKVVGKNSKKRGRKSMVVIAAGPSLMIDGDKMNNDVEIAEAGLEDGDMVEVVGL